MSNALAVSGIVLREFLRRKDFYVLFIVTALLTVFMSSVNFFNDDKITRYVKEACLLLIWAASLVIAISSAARQIPAERENRTVFPLLAKPIWRAEFVAGKFIGCWLACGVALFCFYTLFGCVSMLKEQRWPLANYFQALWLHWAMLGVVIAMTLLGSVIFSAISANITICFAAAVGILLLGRHLNKVALGVSEPARSILQTLYFAIPHLEFFDVRDLLIHNWPGIDWGVCVAASLYASLYAGLLLGASCLLFRRQTLS
jgi:ABC-type transport system involved in multi-copper enzyme maturation permease subunit